MGRWAKILMRGSRMWLSETEGLLNRFPQTGVFALRSSLETTRLPTSSEADPAVEEILDRDLKEHEKELFGDEIDVMLDSGTVDEVVIFSVTGPQEQWDDEARDLYILVHHTTAAGDAGDRRCSVEANSPGS